MTEPPEPENGAPTQGQVQDITVSQANDKLDPGKSAVDNITLPLRNKKNLSTAGDNPPQATSADGEEDGDPEEEDRGEILQDLPPTEQKKKKKKRSKKPKSQRGLVGPHRVSFLSQIPS